jgi:general secretion pathway protein A
MDYVSHWNLQEKPFEEVANTRFFFESEDHREALDRMLYVVNDRNMNMGLLTGEVGSGKTITKNVLCGSLSRQQFEVVNFENSAFPFVDLLYDILQRPASPVARSTRGSSEPPGGRGDRYQLMSAFKSRLEALHYDEKRHLVLIFDEAQQMEAATLDEVKNLTNISSETDSFLTIFLVGQPELRQKVRALPQVDQRIFLRFHLNNLDYASTVKYIQHRLRIAGLSGESIFTPAACELVFRQTGGVPREINRLCKLALSFGFAERAREIGDDDIRAILEDFGKHR